MKKIYVAALAATLLCLGVVSPVSAQVQSWGSSIGGTAFEQPFPVTELSSASSIATGNSTDGAIVEGKVMTWKDGVEGQLGNGAFTDSEMPVEATFPAGTVITQLSRGGRDTEYARTSTGHLFTWGEGLSGTLCLGKGVKDIGVPTEVPGLSEVVEVQAAGQQVAILRANGTVDECGGIFAKESFSTPTQITSFSGIAEISVASDIAGRRANGELFAFGLNTHGELCNGSVEEVGPAVVHLANEVTQVSEGVDVAKNGQVLWLSHGELWGCGADTEAQLGNASTVSPVTTPVDTGLHFSQIASGGNFGLGVYEGEVYSWGANNGGDLGDGYVGSTKHPQLEAKPVTEGTGVSAQAENGESNG